MNSFVSFECELWMFCFVILPQLNTRFSMYSQCYAIITTISIKRVLWLYWNQSPFKYWNQNWGLKSKPLIPKFMGSSIFPRFLSTNPSTCSLRFPVVCFTTAQITMNTGKIYPPTTILPGDYLLFWAFKN